MKIQLSIALISLTFFAITCNSVKTSTQSLNNEIESVLGSNFSTNKNSSSNFLLAWTKDESAETPVLKYAVWEISTREMIYKGSAIRGKVSWIDNWTIELHDYPGIIDDDTPLYRYKIDLRTKTKTALIEEDKI